MRIVLKDGRLFDLTDITEPIATHDYQCAWGDEQGKPHKIEAGRKYVRVTFRVKGSKDYGCKHYCPQCWSEMNND